MICKNGCGITSGAEAIDIMKTLARWAFWYAVMAIILYVTVLVITGDIAGLRRLTGFITSGDLEPQKVIVWGLIAGTVQFSKTLD